MVKQHPDTDECKGHKPIGRIKHVFIPISRQSATWMFKHISNDNIEGLQRMVNKGTLFMIEPNEQG